MDQTDIEYYGSFMPVLLEEQQIILEEIRKILASLADSPEQAPAEHLESRIKCAQSLEAKLKKQGFPSGPASGIENLMDLIGVRIVTHFIGDVYTVLDGIKNSGLWEIYLIKDYIADPKPNGYRSLHVIISLPADVPAGALKAEIQLRTIAMDCWASLEHQLKYKKNIKNTDLIVSELKRCADEMASTDLTLQTIREMMQENI